jgi:hypothetical protein
MLVGQPPFLANTAEETQYKVMMMMMINNESQSLSPFSLSSTGHSLATNAENSIAGKADERGIRYHLKAVSKRGRATGQECG